MCNMALVAIATTGLGALALNILGYIFSSVDEYFKALNKHSNHRENTKWLKQQCLTEGRHCSDDLFMYDESSIPHLRAVIDMIYGSNSLCGTQSCREYAISTWNEINLITFITAIVVVLTVIFCIPYINFVLRSNIGTLPTRIKPPTQLQITEE